MKQKDKNKIWKETLESVRVSVSPAIFSTWISQTHLLSLKKLTEKRMLAEVGCNSTFVKTTVETRYFGLLQDALIRILNTPTDLNFSVKQTPQNLDLVTPLFNSTGADSNELQEKYTKAGLRPGFTFDNFAVSDSNQMAWAAAEAVSNQPGKAYNPLFLWGGVGVGKTHLMHAIGVKIIQKNINAKILTCTSEDFTNGIIEAIKTKTTPSFREKYRKLDVLFIDDIQFIAGKDAVQDEFFHTFNSVTNAGGQIVLTSDKPPLEIARLEERLRSRFEAGLIVDISPPDFELRCAIVQIKAQEKNLKIETDMVHLIAGNISETRQIEGFLIRLASEVKLRNAQISEDLVKNILGKKNNESEINKAKSPDHVIDAVCEYFSISKRAMTGKARSKIVAHPRQILMYLLRNELSLPLEEIGRLLGGRDHTTIMHGVGKITNLSSSNVDTREDILKIKNTF